MAEQKAQEARTVVCSHEREWVVEMPLLRILRMACRICGDCSEIHRRCDERTFSRRVRSSARFGVGLEHIADAGKGLDDHRGARRLLYLLSES